MSRPQLEAALEKIWIPRLCTQRFSGKPWRFLRERQDFIDLIFVEWQEARCRILLGVEPKSFPSAMHQKVPEFTRLPANQWQFHQYVRPKNDFWFHFQQLSNDEALILAQVIDDCVEEATADFFSHFESLESIKRYSPDELITNKQLLNLFNGKQRVAAVFFCNLYLFLGKIAEAKEFAQVGLSIKKGVFGTQQMREILVLED